MSNQSGVVYYLCFICLAITLAICGALTAVFLGLAYGAYPTGSPHEGLEITGYIFLGFFGFVFATTVYLIHHWRCCPPFCYSDF